MLFTFLVAALFGASLWFVWSDPGEPSGPDAMNAPDVEVAVRPGTSPGDGVEGTGTDSGPDIARERAESPGDGTGADSPADVTVVGGTGRVVDDTGAGLGGATVRALLHRQAFVTIHEPLGIEAESTGTGAFRLEGLPGAVAIALAVEKDGYALATVGPIQTPLVGTFTLPTIALGPGLILTGTVRSEPELRPLADATVRVTLDRPDAGQMSIPGVGALSGRTDAGGRFAISGLDFIHYRIEATAPGHAPAVVRRSFIASRGRREVDVSLTLAAADATVKGVVLAGDEPIRGAVVRAVRRPGGADAHSATTRSGADGSFELRGLAREPYEITALAPGYHAPAPSSVTPDDEEVRIILGRNGSLAGRVIAPGGVAAESFSVQVLRVEGGTGVPRPVKRALPAEGPGTFLATDLAPGSYIVEVDSPTAARTRSAVVEVGAEEDVTGVVVTQDAGESVIGRLLDGGGAPLEGVTVLLLDADFDASSAVAEVVQLKPHLGRSTRSRADGRFTLPHLPDGTYGLRAVRVDGGAAFRTGIAVEAGETTDLGDLTVLAGGRLVGVAHGFDDEPLPRARVIAVSNETGSRQSTLTDAAGRFGLERLPAGPYVVSIEAADLWKSFEYTSETAAAVPPAGTAEVTVRVRRR